VADQRAGNQQIGEGMTKARLTMDPALTIGADGKPMRCAIVGCEAAASRYVGFARGDATSYVEYRFCPPHEEVVRAAGFASNEVKPTWEYPPGNWMHDGSDRLAHLRRENRG
jgi:hypothetical protein